MSELKVVTPSEVVSNDSFTDIREAVKDARRKTEESYWDFSVLLHGVYENSYYVGWGYKSWTEYIELELDMQKRKAQYLVSIQEWFRRMSPSVQEWVVQLGWTKAKELVGVVTNDNADHWKSLLEGKSYREMMETRY